MFSDCLTNVESFLQYTIYTTLYYTNVESFLQGKLQLFQWPLAALGRQGAAAAAALGQAVFSLYCIIILLYLYSAELSLFALPNSTVLNCKV